MEYFAASLISFPFLRAWSKQQYYLQISRQKLVKHPSNVEQSPHTYYHGEHCYEICRSPHADKRLYQNLIAILEKNERVPSLVELLDYHGILQTGYCCVMRSLIRAAVNGLIACRINTKYGVMFRRERVTMSDGGTIALDWAIDLDTYYANPGITIEEIPKEKVVILLHGILGDSQSEYIYFFVQQLLKAGYTPVVYIARGCSDLAISSSSFFSGKLANDMYEVVRYIKLDYQKQQRDSRHPHHQRKQKIFAIGYSLGASSLLCYLSRLKENAFLTAAVAVCPPWNVTKVSLYPTTLSKFGSSLIGIPLKLFFFRHYSSVIQHNPEVAHKISYWEVMRSITIKDFDLALYRCFYESSLTANYEREKSLGITEDTFSQETYAPIVPTKCHETLLSYYHDLNSSDHAHEIAVPTLTLSPLDDPICPHHAVPPGNSCYNFGSHVIVVREVQTHVV